METKRRILLVFVLNLVFSIFEFFGGMVTGSTAILSDAVHDMGDSAAIGLSFLLEKKSTRQPDETYTFGYGRYSVLSGVMVSLLLLFGCVMVTIHALTRLFHPPEIRESGMIAVAIVGIIVNTGALFLTHGGHSLNQKAIYLHMLEDVLGWLAVLIGAIVIRLTDWVFIDPILSVVVAVFIFRGAIHNLRESLGLFLEKAPHTVDSTSIQRLVSQVDGVLDVHHIHVWSIDGQQNCATMHVVTNSNPIQVKQRIRRQLHCCGVGHVTLELEAEGEPCRERNCRPKESIHAECHHHHAH